MIRQVLCVPWREEVLSVIHTLLDRKVSSPPNIQAFPCSLLLPLEVALLLILSLPVLVCNRSQFSCFHVELLSL